MNIPPKQTGQLFLVSPENWVYALIYLTVDQAVSRDLFSIDIERSQRVRPPLQSALEINGMPLILDTNVRLNDLNAIEHKCLSHVVSAVEH